MTLLSLMVMLLLPLAQTGASPPSPLQGPLVLRGALELPVASCGTMMQQTSVIEVAGGRCYHVTQPSQQTFRQLEAKLVSLGYNESYHHTTVGVIGSVWKAVGAPERHIVILVESTTTPRKGSVFFSFDQTILAKASADGKSALADERTDETWADGLPEGLEKARRNTSGQTFSLTQEERLRLPRGALKLPAEACRQALRQTTSLGGAPLLGCYHFPQTFTQVRRQVNAAMTALDYREGFADEASDHYIKGWLDTKATEPVIFTINAYSETFGGSLLFELDHKSMQ